MLGDESVVDDMLDDRSSNATLTLVQCLEEYVLNQTTSKQQ